MRKIVKLFFTLILISSVATITSFATPVFAEEAPQVPAPAEATTETPEETTEINGDEWDGIINDPANTSVEEPITTTPTTVVITEVTTTVTPPTTRNYASAPKTETEIEVETKAEVETPTEDTTEASSDGPSTTEPRPIRIAASPTSENIEVPETSTPVFNETTRKITLLALTSTAIVYFLCIGIWGLKNLIKIKKNEKLLKTAKQKAAEVGDAKISRAS